MSPHSDGGTARASVVSNEEEDDESDRHDRLFVEAMVKALRTMKVCVIEKKKKKKRRRRRAM